MTNLFEKVTGDLSQKRKWRESQARIKALPNDYRIAAQAIERYLTYFGGVADGDVLVKMNEDLAALFEEAAADETPIRTLLGDNPVEFVEIFLANYAEGQWIQKERNRLINTIDELAPRGE